MTSTLSALGISSVSMDVTSTESIGVETRKPWSTPRVIVSVAQGAEAHITNNPPDGSTPFSGAYGS